MPPDFSWETLTNEGVNDAALIELEKDVVMSSKVRFKTSPQAKRHKTSLLLTIKLSSLDNFHHFDNFHH